MSFAKRTPKSFGMLAAVAVCTAIIVPTASAMIPDRYHGVNVDAQATPPAETSYTYGVGATLSDLVQSYEWHTPGVGALLATPVVETPTVIVAPKFDGLPVGTVGVFSGALSRPAPADNLPAQAPNVPSELPAFSNDGPMTAPDAFVQPAEPQPVAEPGFDWTDAGIGIAIGALAGLMLGAALLIGRRRGTPAGA